MQQRLELESTCFFCEPRNGSQITEVLSKSTHQTLSICFLHCTCLQLRQIWHNESAVGWQACALQSSHSSLPTRRPSIPDALHLQKPGHNLTQAPMYSDSRTLMVHVPSHLRTGQLVVPASVRTKSSQHEESKKSIVNTPVPRRFRVEDSGGKDYLLLMLTYLMLNLLSHPLLSYLMLCHLCSSIVLTLHGYFDNQTFLRHFMLQCSQKRVSYETSTKKRSLKKCKRNKSARIPPK